ncbi:hypothetical protein ATO11_00500 [Pseudaestuariivita atlantica]|uniref:Copper-binding protein n=1 Tax=Pseudaestuariivita atlantica TaxID=1317121 RepID=A0A0L1JW60_9RHOB|nr:hypothetical protein ATO11_00500 [Pseudaestuariivita atlantica]
MATTESGLILRDGFARAATPAAKAGAAFVVIENPTDMPDRLLAASTDAAKRVELHTHSMTDSGVMRMLHLPEGFEIPAGGQLVLERGGHHVMMMGLTRGLADGDAVEVTFTFERAGPVTVTLPVDLQRGAHGG